MGRRENTRAAMGDLFGALLGGTAIMCFAINPTYGIIVGGMCLALTAAIYLAFTS